MMMIIDLGTCQPCCFRGVRQLPVILRLTAPRGFCCPQGFEGELSSLKVGHGSSLLPAYVCSPPANCTRHLFELRLKHFTEPGKTNVIIPLMAEAIFEIISLKNSSKMSCSKLIAMQASFSSLRG